MRRLLICLLALFAACAVRGAEPPRLDSADYDYPVLHVRGQHSASFGEMRPNHFHSGIDIKTDGAEGKPVVAAASGYVSRIVVSPTGYGRALYLTLDNGYTAVYGHLSRFRDDLEQFAESERRRLRRNKVDLSCPPDRFRVCRGDRIAFSGNTGSSFGPHLHFELRETATQRTLNLVRQGIARPEDDMPPVIVRIRYIETDTVQGVPVHRAPAVCDAVRVDAGTYRLARPTPLPVGANGSFVVEATDRRNGVTNTFGLYRVTLYVDGEPHYEYRMDGFTFDRSRDCNVAACYSVQIASRNEAIRLARVEGAPDFFCPVAVRRGAVGAAEGERRSLRIEAEDDCGNISRLDFEVVGRAPWHAVRDTLAVRCDRSRTHVLTCPGARAVLPAGALYESAFLRLRPSGVRIACDTSLLVLSPAYRFLPCTEPLRKPAEVRIEAYVPEALRPHAVLAALDRRGRPTCVGGTCSGGGVTARTAVTGDLFVAADTVAPSVRPLFGEGADLGTARRMSFRTMDNFSGIASCELRIDGEWVPCDRQPVRGTVTHTFALPRTGARHTYLLEVRDRCGNAARRTGTFVR